MSYHPYTGYEMLPFPLDSPFLFFRIRFLLPIHLSNHDFFVFWSSDLLIFWSSDLLIFWSSDLLSDTAVIWCFWFLYHVWIRTLKSYRPNFPEIRFIWWITLIVWNSCFSDVPSSILLMKISRLFHWKWGVDVLK